jgi:hypothetical protein
MPQLLFILFEIIISVLVFNYFLLNSFHFFLQYYRRNKQILYIYSKKKLLNVRIAKENDLIDSVMHRQV